MLADTRELAPLIMPFEATDPDWRGGQWSSSFADFPFQLRQNRNAQAVYSINFTTQMDDVRL